MNSLRSDFTYASIERQYQKALDYGYQFITCADYAKNKCAVRKHTVVNRVDIDFSVKRAESLLKIFDALKIKATFFIRLHAHEYNPTSFENYRIIKNIINSGHEIGYHSEIVDAASIWNEDPADVLRRDIEIVQKAFGTQVYGVASHGGLTGLNNLDFWTSHKPAEFGLLYEAYDREPGFNLFQESLYVSDSEWTRWKCYRRGKLAEGDRRCFGEHLLESAPLIYLLIHSDTYFKRHFYE